MTLQISCVQVYSASPTEDYDHQTRAEPAYDSDGSEEPPRYGSIKNGGYGSGGSVPRVGYRPGDSDLSVAFEKEALVSCCAMAVTQGLVSCCGMAVIESLVNCSAMAVRQNF